MSGKIYNVDAILEQNKPIIRFRGKDYEVKDLTVKEMVSSISKAKSKEEKIDKIRRDRVEKEVRDEGFPDEEIEDEVERRLAEIAPEEAFQDYIPLVIDNLCSAIVDFPRSVEEDLTFREFEALKGALQAANSQIYDVEPESGKKKKER